MISSTQIFAEKAPGIMRKLMKDFPSLGVNDAAAIVGNLGHECNGFTVLQEVKPVVQGSRGGYGWAQWTGVRRRTFEGYCARNNLDPASDQANYAYLFLELKGGEAKAITRLAKVSDLASKVRVFEMSFLRAHKDAKHYDSRIIWAKRAVAAWEEAKS